MLPAIVLELVIVLELLIVMEFVSVSGVVVVVVTMVEDEGRRTKAGNDFGTSESNAESLGKQNKFSRFAFSRPLLVIVKICDVILAIKVL
jgi:hypothetical protein